MTLQPVMAQLLVVELKHFNPHGHNMATSVKFRTKSLMVALMTMAMIMRSSFKCPSMKITSPLQAIDEEGAEESEVIQALLMTMVILKRI